MVLILTEKTGIIINEKLHQKKKNPPKYHHRGMLNVSVICDLNTTETLGSNVSCSQQ